MKFLLLLCLFLLASLSQPTYLQIKKAETELVQLNKKGDSLLLKIEDLKFKKIHEDLLAVALPTLLPGEEVVYHNAYALVYSEADEQAKWVAHIILPDVVRGNEGRSNDFRPDSLIKTGIKKN